jgi:hypothetical protein
MKEWRIYFKFGPGLSLLVELAKAHRAPLALLAAEDGLPMAEIGIVGRQMRCKNPTLSKIQVNVR